MRTRETGPSAEAKTTDLGKAQDHASNEETHGHPGSHLSRLASQPGGNTLPKIHSARLNHLPHFQSFHAGNHLLQLQRQYGNRHVQRMLNVGREDDTDELQRKPFFESSENAIEDEPVLAKSDSEQLRISSDLHQSSNNSKGSGRTVPKDTRSSFESAFGSDVSNVSIHPGPDAEEIKKGLGARAFTNGSDIYFNEGKYDPGSSSGKHLAHVVQHGEGALHTNRQTGKQGEYLKSDVPKIQGSWYNFDIPFTDYQFDPSIEGVKTAANVAKDTVVDSAAWVKDKAVAGFEWIFDQVKDLISSGIDWLNDKFSEIKEFATSSFDTVRNGLSNLLGYITSPVSLIMSAFTNMDADLLGTAWNALTSGAALVWNGIKTVVDGIFKIGTGIWNAVSGYVSSLFASVSSIIDSWPFRQLPEFLQRKAKDLFNEIRSLWEEIRNFISDTLKRLRAFTDGILQSIESFVQKVLSYAIQKVIETVRAIKGAWDFVKKIADDPEGFVRPIVDQVVAQLNSEAPPKAIELGHRKLQENAQGDESSAVATGNIQRQVSTTKPKRSTASALETDQGVAKAITAAWAQLDIGHMLWESFVNMFWPPATIRAIGHEFSELWSTDWANTVANFFKPRNILEEPAGFFHDVWSNILVFLDFPLALWRRLNSVFMLLLGYLTIVLVIVGAVGGGIAGAAAGGVGAIPGAMAGAWAGLELAGAIGLGLLASYFAAESVSVIKWIVELRTARQTQEEKNRDYVQIAGSLIGMAVAAVLVAILWLLSEFVSAIVRGIKGGGVAPEVDVKPATEVKPPAEAGLPTEPTPPTKEVKPPQTEDVKPPTEGEVPEIVDGERVVGKEPTADGHEIKITEEGRCLICTTCEEIQIKYAEELKGETPEIESIKTELEEARKLPNGDEKAKAIENVKEKLDKVRQEARKAETPEMKAEGLKKAKAESFDAVQRIKETLKKLGDEIKKAKAEGKATEAKAMERAKAEIETELRGIENEWTRANESAEGITDPDLQDLARDEFDDIRTKAEQLEEKAKENLPKADIPDYVRENRTPLDSETVLADDSRFSRTGKKQQGREVYVDGDGKQYYVDNYHTGKGSEIEVFDSRGKHLGTISPDGVPKDPAIPGRTID